MELLSGTLKYLAAQAALQVGVPFVGGWVARVFVCVGWVGVPFVGGWVACVFVCVFGGGGKCVWGGGKWVGGESGSGAGVAPRVGRARPAPPTLPMLPPHPSPPTRRAWASRWGALWTTPAAARGPTEGRPPPPSPSPRLHCCPLHSWSGAAPSKGRRRDARAPPPLPLPPRPTISFHPNILVPPPFPLKTLVRSVAPRCASRMPGRGERGGGGLDGMWLHVSLHSGV